MKFPEQYRIQDGQFATVDGMPYGAFHVPGSVAGGRSLRIIADDGRNTGWEHVSVSLDFDGKKLNKTTPNWQTMCFVKDLFWEPEDCVVQFHPPASKHVNDHPGVLHLWRKVEGDFPMPPILCV